MSKPRPWIFLCLELVAFFIIALLPRVWRLPADLQITYDQGLHSQAIWNIWHDGHLSLLGHPTDVPGIFHSPVYYWMMLPFYVLGRGDPAFPAIWQAVTHAFSVVLIYILSLRLFNRRTARVSALLFGFSYGFISFARWLSNVNPVIPFALVYFLTLERFLRKSVLWFPVSALLCALLIEFNGAIGIFLLPLLLIAALLKIKNIFIPRWNLPLGLIAFVLPHLPLVLFDLRHQFLITKSILNYSGSTGTGLGFSFSHVGYDLWVLADQLNSVLAWPYWAVTVSLLLLTAIIVYRKRHLFSVRFLLFGIFVPVLGLLAYRRGAIGFFFWAVLPLILILISFSLSVLNRSLLKIVLIIIIAVNLSHWTDFLSPHPALTPMGTRNLITENNRENIITWIYKKAGGRPIYLWMYTIPYRLEDPWRYFFIWYGQSKYGSLPVSWGGLSRVEIPSSGAFFAIYEPNKDQPSNLIGWQNRLDSEFTEKIASFRSGDVLVEYRK